jgi:cytochrome c553
MKKKLVWSLLMAGLSWSAVVPVAVAAGDSEEGKKKFYTCVGCHGVAGYTNAYPTYHVPRLGGQHADYLVSALKAYQSGERKHSSMLGNAVSLKEDDLEDIGAYLAKFRGMNSSLPTTGNVTIGKQKAEACGSCHGEDGNSTAPNFPRLAGQYESYLVKALEDYKSGARNNPMMAGFAAALSEADMKDIAAYYASQKKGLTTSGD